MHLNELIGKKSISSELVDEAKKWDELDLIKEIKSLPLETKKIGYFNILSEYLIELRINGIPTDKISEFADELHNLPHLLKNYTCDFKDEFFWEITDIYIKNILLGWFIEGIRLHAK